MENRLLGILWWSKDADPDKLPEMHEATPEQLAGFEIERDEDGKFIRAKLKGTE